MPQPVVYLSYEKICQDLINAGMNKDEIYYLRDTPLEAVFSNFFWMWQTWLSVHDKKMNIYPARFFFNTTTTVNAKAGFFNGYFIISINSGLIVHTTSFFVTRKTLIESFDGPLLNSIKNICPDSIPQLMRDFCVRFTFDHEFAHLCQRNNFRTNWLDNEYCLNSSEEKFSTERHVCEFDADMRGAIGVASAIHHYWLHLKKEHQSIQTLNALVCVGMISFGCKFLLGHRELRPLYFNEFKHPHPLIRTFYIGQGMINTLKYCLGDQYQFDWNSIQKETHLVVKLLIEDAGIRCPDSDCFKFITSEVVQYVQTTLEDNLQCYPYLTYFNEHIDQLEISMDKIYENYDYFLPYMEEPVNLGPWNLAYGKT